MTNHQIFDLITPIAGAVGWVLLLLLAAYCLSLKERYRILTNDFNQLKKTYQQTHIQLKNHTNHIIDQFSDAQKTMPDGYTYVRDSEPPKIKY